LDAGFFDDFFAAVLPLIMSFLLLVLPLIGEKKFFFQPYPSPDP